LEAQDLVADLDAFTRENVLAWLQSLRTRGLTDGTILTRWRGLRRFTNWLLSEQIIHADPLAGIRVDAPEAPSVPILTDEELSALLAACSGRTFTDLRDTAFLRLLIDCGVRVGEMCGIDLKHLNLDEGCVQVTGKGSRVRMAYFGNKTGVALDRYLRARRGHRHAADPALLLSQRGRFTDDGVRERLKVLAEVAGLDPETVHPHRFRHTHAHDFLLAGGGERDLMRLAGWRSAKMLERYGASAADLRARESTRRLARGDRV
jgi:site-specific recombinase XerD